MLYFLIIKLCIKIYEDQGSFNFIYQIPQIIYSTIISTFINILLKTLSLTQKNILELKNNKENVLSKEKSLLGSLRIKFVILKLSCFFSFGFIWPVFVVYIPILKSSFLKIH